MRVARALVGLCVVTPLALGTGPGCGGQQEIPLAKVPPPPEGFGKPMTTKGAPPGASPTDTTQFTK